MIDELGLAAKKFDRFRRETKRARWKERRNLVFASIAGFAWAAFCAAGAVGLVGRDHPYLGACLAGAVWLAGIYLAIRVWGDKP